MLIICFKEVLSTCEICTSCVEWHMKLIFILIIYYLYICYGPMILSLPFLYVSTNPLFL